ncbi:HMGL-like-domain-containing protein [Immersiella caudata]|uniref:homocitrate synthase n=1 Tax=Immersiella caudata TaxID=314043 RepID=A0AA39WQB9_9PEZI|nr:HMGL-like-domain-containing protein [Immersiella caudata]
MTRPEDINGSPTVANRRPVIRNPYQPVGDFVSNVSRFKIIESTLREGEQFANAFFDTETKIKIAKALDDFGVDYIELTSPAASEQSRRDCEAICKLGLKAKILTHVRCTMEDARIAVETGVDGLDVVIGTSHFLREFSHGKDMEYITKSAIEVINFIKSKGLEVRFSSEDSFRSDLVDLLSLYRTVDRVGVNRVGIADTVGCATPRQVYDLVRTLRGVVSCDIEIHLHNDTGCAIANAYCALEAGATHIDTSVIGIGERNGITSLGGLMARMIVADREYVTKKYKLHKLKELEDLVAEAVQVNTPFNNPITGFCAFTHKAGIHAKAILNNPSTYEIINPADFGLTRYVHFASRLTGWNAVKTRVGQLGLSMTDDQVKVVTQKIKALADVRPIAIDDADSIIRTFHLSLGGEAAASDKVSAEKTPQKDEEGEVPAKDGNGDIPVLALNGEEPQPKATEDAVEVPVEAPAVTATVQPEVVEVQAAEIPEVQVLEVLPSELEVPVAEAQSVETQTAKTEPTTELLAAVESTPAQTGVEAEELPANASEFKHKATSASEITAEGIPAKSVDTPVADVPATQTPVEIPVEAPAVNVAEAKEIAEEAAKEVQIVEAQVETAPEVPAKASTIETPVVQTQTTAPQVPTGGVVAPIAGASTEAAAENAAPEVPVTQVPTEAPADTPVKMSAPDISVIEPPVEVEVETPVVVSEESKTSQVEVAVVAEV